MGVRGGSFLVFSLARPTFPFSVSRAYAFLAVPFNPVIIVPSLNASGVGCSLSKRIDRAGEISNSC